ncbi:galactose oxidase [Pisolithus marmoratus]|nr:galactose oxidase [Pisolithus marmoratus]
MVKKSGTNKAAAKAAKKERAVQKTARKEKKKVSKAIKPEDQDDDEDLESILDKIKREWEESHTVTEEVVEGPPSKRANATLTACPNGNHLWSIGGEFFSEDGKAYFYNDVLRYSPEKNEWRKFISPTCPGPRSAHSVVASPAGGGKLFLFGGEFSSLFQNSFHHYRDFWVFDIPSHSWERIETKIRPSARSGHRMAMWKHYIVLFGGFYDPGYRTRYLNDTWVFDTQEYKWKQIEFKEADRKPSPRSGFSFLPTSEGVVLYGGYCKEYVKGKRPVGVILDDTWLLRITLDHATAIPTFKWEKRRVPSSAHVPSPRAGATMALWSARGMGVMFGGVTDVERDEEGMESVFWADLHAYHLENNKWTSMNLKRPKKAGSRKKKQARHVASNTVDPEDSKNENDKTGTSQTKTTCPEQDVDDPELTKPMTRYNAMLAVLRNTLYIYGGILERGSREYTLDDFYTIQLDKLDKYSCLRSMSTVIPEDVESSSEDESGSDTDSHNEDDSDTDEDNDEISSDIKNRRARAKKNLKQGVETEEGNAPSSEEEPAVAAVTDLRAQASAFMNASAQNGGRSAEDIISTPAPGETLAMFYARSREYWAQKAHARGAMDSRGKQLRRDGFGLAEERYTEYKPILEEVEKILAEAGLDEKEMREVGRDVGAVPSGGQSRNRR